QFFKNVPGIAPCKTLEQRSSVAILDQQARASIAPALTMRRDRTATEVSVARSVTSENPRNIECLGHRRPPLRGLGKQPPPTSAMKDTNGARAAYASNLGNGSALSTSSQNNSNRGRAPSEWIRSARYRRRIAEAGPDDVSVDCF